MNRINFKIDSLFILVLAIAALLRIALLLEDIRSNPLAQIPLVDAAIHHDLAIKITQDGLIQESPFKHPPLYAYFLAGIYTLFGESPISVAVIQTFLGMLGLILLFKVAKIYKDRTSALLATCLAAFYGPLAFFELKLLPASLSVILTLFFLYFLLKYSSGKSALWAALTGLVGGILVLDRPNLVFIPLLAILWSFITSPQGCRKSAAIMLMGLLLGVAPAWIHNYLAGDGTVPVCSNGGLNFYLGNRYGADASLTKAFEGATDPTKMHEQSTRVYFQETNKVPESLSTLERYWFRKGFQEILSHPMEWLILIINKAKALVSEFEYGINYSYESEKYLMGTLKYFMVPFSLLLCLGIGGLIAPSKTTKAPFVLVLIGIALSTLVFFSYSRFRIASVPLLAILGTNGFFAIARSIQDKRWSIIAILVAPGLAAGALALIQPGEIAKQQVSAGHSLAGAAFFRTRNINASIQAYERAIQTHPSSLKAYQTLADIYRVKGDLHKAKSLHLKAIEKGWNDPDILIHSALFFLTSPRPYMDLPLSKNLVQRAKSLDKEYPMTYFCIGILCSIQGKEKESEINMDLALHKSNRAPWLLRNIADWYKSRGLNNKARLFERELSQQGK